MCMVLSGAIPQMLLPPCTMVKDSPPGKLNKTDSLWVAVVTGLTVVGGLDVAGMQ